MPTAQISDELYSTLQRLCQENSADGIIIAGDLKHHIGSITKQEWDEIPRFLERLLKITQVYLVPGNHDSNIRNLVPANVNFASAKGMVVERTLVLHGHSLPSSVMFDVDTLVMGHVHPTLSRAGSVLNGLPVWVYLQIDRSVLSEHSGLLDIVVIPSFNTYLYTSSSGNLDAKLISSNEQIRTRSRNFYRSKSISPITSRIVKHPESIMKCVITTLDGSVVGSTDMLTDVL